MFAAAAVVALLAIGVYLILARSRGSDAGKAWGKWPFLFFLGYGLAAALAAFLIAPTGPGSGRIAFIVMAVYSIIPLLLGARRVKVIALILGLLFLIGIAVETKAGLDFERAMQEQRAQTQTEDEGLQP